MLLRHVQVHTCSRIEMHVEEKEEEEEATLTQFWGPLRTYWVINPDKSYANSSHLSYPPPFHPDRGCRKPMQERMQGIWQFNGKFLRDILYSVGWSF